MKKRTRKTKADLLKIAQAKEREKELKSGHRRGGFDAGDDRRIDL